MADTRWVETLLGCVLLALAAAPACAGTVKRTTTAGTEVKIAQHVDFDGNCSGRVPRMDVSQPPAHGKVEVRPGKFVLKAALKGSFGEACVGQEVNGGQLFYTPEAGFTGTDTFTYTTYWGQRAKGSLSNTDTAMITVK